MAGVKINLMQAMMLLMGLGGIYMGADTDGDGKVEPNEFRTAAARALALILKQFPNLFPADAKIRQPGQLDQCAEDLSIVMSAYCD